MAKSINDVRRTSNTLPPRIVIYGPPGVGKTSLAAEFPAPIFIQTEDGTPAGLELDSFGAIESWEDVISAMRELAGAGHDYQTIVIDSLDRLEHLIWAHTCEVNGWDSIEAPGYGKGYIEVDKLWLKFGAALDYLRSEARMNTVLIGHSHIINWPNPAGAEFARWDFRLHKRAHGIIEDNADAVLFLNYDMTTKEEKTTRKIKSSGSTLRWIHCAGTPALNAKNRFRMPAKVLFQEGQGHASLSLYFPHVNGGVQPQQTEKEDE